MTGRNSELALARLPFNALNKETRRFFRFLVVGISGTLIDLGLLTLLVKLCGMATLPANTISFSVGVVNNFLLNRFWTYPEARQKPVLRQALQFAAVNVIGLLLSDLIITGAESALVNWLGANAYLPAKALSIGLVFFWNYFANRLWTYNDVDAAIAA